MMDFDVGMCRLARDALLRRARERLRRAVLPVDFWKIEDELFRSVPGDEALAPQRMVQIELVRDPAALDRWFRAELVEILREGRFDDRHFDGLDGWEVLGRLARELRPAPCALVLEALDADEITFIDEFWFGIEVTLTSLRVGTGRPCERSRMDPDDVAACSYRIVADADITVHPITLERALKRTAEWMARHVHRPSWRGWKVGANVPDADELDALRELQAVALRNPECLDLILKDEVVTTMIMGGQDDMVECPDVHELLRGMVRRLPPSHRRTLLPASATRGELFDAMLHLFSTLHVEMRGLRIWERP